MIYTTTALESLDTNTYVMIALGLHNLNLFFVQNGRINFCFDATKEY